MPRNARLRRPPAHRLAPLLAAAAILAACGASTPAGHATRSSAVSILAQSGLRYTFDLTDRNGEACATQTYAALRKTRNFPQTSRFCGPIGQVMPPMLIQVSHPAATLILDRPTACAAVMVARGHARAVAATRTCSPTAPLLRVTLLPAGHSFTITGIPGVAVVDLARSRCSFICTRQLAVAPGPGG